MSFDEFERRLPEVCLSHRAQGRALAFALVLHDARQPHLRKALDDDTYWEALDALSGRSLTVFSFECAPRRSRPVAASPNGRELLVAVRGSPSRTVHDALATHFPGLSVRQLPTVLFFQVDEHGEILDSCAATLLSNPADPAAAYNSLQTVLQVAVASLQHVEVANAENAREVYQLIVEGLHDLAVKQRIRAVFTGIKAVSGVATIARLVSALV